MSETEYTTIRVTREAWREAVEQKEAHERTWNEQIVRPDGDGGDDDVLQAIDRLERKVERLADGVATAGDASDYGDAGTDFDELVRRLQDIRNELPKEIATELQR